ncbi:hypothetical protein FRC07_005599 [Ceratobasidium sp. 392]|nr:hypothetical protein FRC07_005599 [Ceratobasidium sp. 392]
MSAISVYTTDAKYNTSDVYRILGDLSSVTTVLNALTSNCSVAGGTIFNYDPTSDDLAHSLPRVESVIQYYRASSFALALDGYNNSAALFSVAATSNTTQQLVTALTPATSLPPTTNHAFLECVNTTVASSVPLVDAGFNNLPPMNGLGLQYGGLASNDAANSDILLVDPTAPHAFDEFLRTRPVEQRPPVVLAYWVPLCILAKQVVWYEHPHWSCICIPYERLPYPSVPVGVLAYGSFLAGRVSARLVPPVELLGQTPELMAKAIVASSGYVAQESGSQLPLDPPSNDAMPATSVPALPSTVPAVATPAAAAALVTDRHSSMATSALSSEPNDSFEAPAPVGPLLSPVNTKRAGSGLKIATIGNSKWNGPLDRRYRVPKSHRVLQKTSSSSSQSGLAGGTSHPKPVAPDVQPQTGTALSGSENATAPSAVTEAASRGTNGISNGKLPPTPTSIENGTSRSNGMATREKEAENTIIVTEPTSNDALPPIQPATSTNGARTSSAPQDNTIALSAPSVDTTRDLALTFLPAPALFSSKAPPVATLGNSRTGAQVPHATKRFVLKPLSKSSMPRSSGGPETSTTNHTNGKAKDKVINPPAPTQSTQSTIASTLKSTPAISNGHNFSSSSQSESTSELNRPRFNLVRFASGSPDRPSNGNGASHARPNGSLKPQSLNGTSSSSSLSLVPLATNPNQPPPPALPEILPEYRGSDKDQWLKDEAYMVAYMNWRYKQDPSLKPIDIIKEIAIQAGHCSLLPRRNPDAWRRRFNSHESDVFAHQVFELKKRFHNKTSSVNPKTANKPQTINQPVPEPITQPPIAPSPPSRPLPPITPPELEGTKIWTDEEDQFLVDYMNWCFDEDPTAATDDILREIASQIPRHSYQAWSTRFLSRETMVYSLQVPELFRRMTNRTSRVNPSGPRMDDPNPTPAASSIEGAQKRKRKYVSYKDPSDEDKPGSNSDSDSDSDSDSSEGGSEDPHGKMRRSERLPDMKKPRYTI